MAAEKVHGTQESELLSMNIESISKELNNLLYVTEGLADRAMAGAISVGSEVVVSAAQRYAPPELPRESHYMQNVYKKQQHLVATTGLGSVAQNATIDEYHTSLLAQTFNSGHLTGPVQNMGLYPYGYLPQGSLPKRPMYSGALVPPLVNCPPPKCEFHYLRSQSFNSGKVKVETVPLISMTAREEGFGRSTAIGAFRKYLKPPQRQYSRDPREGYDYDKIVVDLSVLGWSEDGKEPNPVLRLFGLLRDVHNAIAEVPASPKAAFDDEYECTFARLPKSSMPCTMNVQYQVKQAARKCSIFLCDMQRILSVNKVYDHGLYVECESHLNTLRKLLAQLEVYKRIELEHKRGLFVTEDMRVKAEHLEHLLQEISEQIRIVHLQAAAFDWYVGIRNRAAVSELTTKTSKIPSRSEKGVINEILELCNARDLSNKPEAARQFDKQQHKELGAATASDIKESQVQTARQPVFYIG